MILNRRILYYIILVSCLTTCQVFSQELNKQQWIDSCFQSMSLDQKIGQLFMIRAHSDLGDEHIQDVKNQIKNYHVGGLCFFQGSPEKQAQLNNAYQQLSDLPLMVAMDAEWGLGMRLKDHALSYPKQLTLGAIHDNTLIYDMGRDIAHQLRRIGVHINFAPVADVNNNPSNPVIHNRSFGEDIYNVATKSYAYMKALQDNGVLACAKHFPGHGDTDVDSHYDLPLIRHSKQRLDSLELMPFRVLSQLGVGSMMSAHLSIPALDNRENRPSSLSHKVLSELLRAEMNFEGLIFTDGLEMQGVARHFEPGQMELEALKAGNDVLLLPIDIQKAFTEIKNAVLTGRLSEASIDEKVRRILEAKYFLGLDDPAALQVNLSGISRDINKASYLSHIYKLYERSISLVRDKKQMIPLIDYEIPRTASLSIGASRGNRFQERLGDLGITENQGLPGRFNAQQMQTAIDRLRPYDNIIISIHDMSIYKKRDFGISAECFDLIYKLNNQKNVILVIFGTPYALEYFNDIETILLAYEDNEIVQDVCSQSLLGVNRIRGKLPVTVNSHFPIRSGIETPGLFRLGYAIPENVGINSDTLLKIDTIVQDMILKNAAPGCQILAAKDGKIFFQKSYGFHTPDSRLPVEDDDVYDVASVTKILSTTIALMKLYDEGKINLYEKFGKYLNHIDTSNKARLIIEDVLAHHAGLPGWIPFYRATVDSDKISKFEKYYRPIQSDSFNIRVCQNMYLRNDYRDSIFNMIYGAELRDNREYRYSDLGFYLFQEIIESRSGQKLDQYVSDNFYKPLNLKRTMYNPLDQLEKDDIIPSEKDDYYRNCVLHGYVHDMGAAMLGGVAGHAGLFSNSKELAILMQMLLNGGSYGGNNYIKPNTVERFTRRYFKSTRRGLGFDMKELDPDRTLNMAEEASPYTFGHLGFTGIAVFADPKYNMIYVMLTNRTYPSMENYIFSKENYRPRIQSVFYRAMMDN